MSLRWRLALGVAAIELAMLTVLILGMVGVIRDVSLDAVKRQAEASTELFAAAATSAVITYDLATLDALIDKIRQQPDMQYARLTHVSGDELASFDRFAEGNSPIQELELFVSSSDLVSSAAVIGTIEIGYDLSPRNSIVASAYQWGISMGLFEMILVAIATYFLCSVLTRELEELRQRSANLATGDMQTPVLIRSKLPEVALISRALESLRVRVLDEVSNLREANASLKVESKAKADALQRLQDESSRNAQVYAVLGHEIRTPISLATMLLRDPDTRLKTSPILGNLEHALELVDDLHVRSNLTTQSQRYSDIDLSDFLQELQIGLTPLFKSESMGFSVDELHGPDARVHMPITSLRQILRNLLKNACVHSGGSTVALRTHLTEQNEGIYECRFEVIDDGKGISEENQQRIFDTFVKLDPNSKGSGLGLSVCKDLAAVINADLELISSSQGSRFILTLLLEAAPVATPAQSAKEVCKLISLAGKHILVVEDNPMIQMLTHKVLTTAGAKVTLACDGLDALEKYGDFHELILTDIHMPNMDGIELTRELRSRGLTVPIIGVTAATIGKESLSLLQAGASDYLTKPFDLRALQAKLMTLFSSLPQAAPLNQSAG